MSDYHYKGVPGPIGFNYHIMKGNGKLAELSNSAATMAEAIVIALTYPGRRKRGQGRYTVDGHDDSLVMDSEGDRGYGVPGKGRVAFTIFDCTPATKAHIVACLNGAP